MRWLTDDEQNVFIDMCIIVGCICIVVICISLTAGIVKWVIRL